MKKALLILLALAGCKDKDDGADKVPTPTPVAADAAAPKEETLRVTLTSPQIGDTFVIDETSHSTMTIGKDVVEDHEKRTVTVKVVGVMGPAVAQAEARYDAHEVTRAAGGKTDTPTSALAGNTYLVVKKGEAIEVTRTDGKKGSEEERELVAADFPELGRVPVIAEVIRNKVWTRGERVELTGEQLAELGKTGGGEGAQPVSGWLTWTGRDGDLATFEGEIAVKHDTPAMTLDSTLKTQLALEPTTARLRKMTLNGTVTGQVKGPEPQPVSGTMTATTTITPGPQQPVAPPAP